MSSVLIDSNIIIYALNSSSPKNLAAQEYIEGNKQSLYFSPQNVLETLRILTHSKYVNPMPSTTALACIQSVTKHLTVISPDLETYEIFLGLIKKHGIGSNQVFDAYLAATALTYGIDTIATDNTKDFNKISGINVFNPFS